MLYPLFFFFFFFFQEIFIEQGKWSWIHRYKKLYIYIYIYIITIKQSLKPYIPSYIISSYFIILIKFHFTNNKNLKTTTFRVVSLFIIISFILIKPFKFANFQPSSLFHTPCQNLTYWFTHMGANFKFDLWTRFVPISQTHL